MKILIVTPYFKPLGVFGRIPEMTYQLAKNLTQNQHQVEICTTNILDLFERTSAQTEEIEGITVRRFQAKRRQFAKISAWCCPRKIKKYLRTHIANFDLVFLAGVRDKRNVIAAKYAVQNNIPYIIAPYGKTGTKSDQRLSNKLFFRLWGKELLQNAAVCIAQTEHEAESLKQQGVEENKITIIPLALDVNKYTKLPPKNTFRIKHQIPVTDKLIMFFGRIHQDKLPEKFIRMFADLVQRVRNVKLVIAGRNDGHLTRLRQLLQELEIDQNEVIFPGILHGEEKLAAFHDADIYCAAPRWPEETSLSALEALACQNVIVVTPECAIPELEKYEAGFIVENDAKALADKLEELLDRPNKRDQMGQNAVKLVNEVFAWQQVWPKYLDLFKKTQMSSAAADDI